VFRRNESGGRAFTAFFLELSHEEDRLRVRLGVDPLLEEFDVLLDGTGREVERDLPGCQLALQHPLDGGLALRALQRLEFQFHNQRGLFHHLYRSEVGVDVGRRVPAGDTRQSRRKKARDQNPVLCAH
jgi:hypothetical protein